MVVGGCLSALALAPCTTSVWRRPSGRRSCALILGLCGLPLVAVLLAIRPCGCDLDWSGWCAGGPLAESGGGVVMGLAIAAPHYVAMAALRFIDAPGELELATTVEWYVPGLAVAAVALVIGAGHRYQRRPALPADVPADATERVPPARHCRHGRGRHGDDRCAGAGAVLQRSGRTHPGLAPRGRGGPERVHPDARARPSRHDTYIQRYLQGQGGGRSAATAARCWPCGPMAARCPSAFPLAACRWTAIRCLWASSTTSPSAAPWSRS